MDEIRKADDKMMLVEIELVNQINKRFKAKFFMHWKSKDQVLIP